MKTFGEVIAWEPDGEGAWTGQVPPSWMQGRTAFGGIAAAVGLRALRAVEGEGRPPRTVYTSFFSPLRAEPARVVARVVRRGRFLTHARAEITQGDEPVAQVVGTFADDRPSSVVVDTQRAPERPSPEGLRDVPFIEGMTPAFVKMFSMRWTDGAFPFSGGKDPRLGGWCRHVTDPGPDPYAAVLGLLDAWPSPFVTLMRGPAPASSVTWSTSFVDVPATFDPDAWWWYGSEGIAADHGHGTMRARLFGPQGRLAATVEQLVAVFDQPAPKPA